MRGYVLDLSYFFYRLPNNESSLTKSRFSSENKGQLISECLLGV